MEKTHLTQSKIYYYGRVYTGMIVREEITFEEAIAEVRASEKIDDESKSKVAKDIYNKWRDYHGYHKPRIDLTQITTEQTNNAFDTIE
jgi:hypothetical protein